MALATVKAEAVAQPVEVVWRDRKFTIAPADDWLFLFTHHIDRGQLTLAVEVMLGPPQYAEFTAATPPPRMSDVEGLMNQTLSILGIDAGESPASTG